MPGYSAIYYLPMSEVSELAYFFEAGIDHQMPSDSMMAWSNVVEKWRDRHFSKNGPASLSLVDFGAFGLIHDTRTISNSEYVVLNEAETLVLRSFREPKYVSGSTEKLAKELNLDEPRLKAALSSLLDKSYLAKYGEKAVSIVLDFAFSLDSGPQGCGSPFGEWTPALDSDSLDGARVFNRDRTSFCREASPTAENAIEVAT